jgi:hypothetical protein
MVDEDRDLATRRGRPVSEYGALFPGGRVWHWIVGVSYAGLVALEAIGNEVWRVAATPYLDIALFVGLVATVWRETRPPTRHERNAKMRANLARLNNTPVELAVAARYGLLDEKGELIDDTPPAWVDELTPERTTFDAGKFIVRVALTPALALMVWVVLLVGLAAVRQARDHWLIAAPVMVALVGLIWFSSRTRRAHDVG